MITENIRKTTVFISDTNVRRFIFKYSCLALRLLVNFCESRTRTFCIWILPSLHEIIHQSLNSFWMSNVISDSQINDTLQYWEKVSNLSHVFIKLHMLRWSIFLKWTRSWGTNVFGSIYLLQSRIKQNLILRRKFKKKKALSL